MVTLVIESLPSVLKWALENDSGLVTEIHFEKKTTARKTSDIDHWVWLEPNEHLTAYDDDCYTSLELWESISSEEDITAARTAAEILIEGVAFAIESDQRFDQIVFLLPDGTPEFSQNVIISELAARFGTMHKSIFLLWRSVAVSLCDIERNRVNKDQLIFDCEHLVAVGTHLEVTYRDGKNCPVRNFTKNTIQDGKYQDHVSSFMKRNYDVVEGEPLLENHAFEADLIELLNKPFNFDPPEFWRNEKNESWMVRQSHDDWAVPNKLDSLLRAISEYSRNNAGNWEIVWNGWPAYWNGEDELKKYCPSSRLLEPDACIHGGLEFASRIRLGFPTFFEDIPGYDIWCVYGSLGRRKTYQWEPLLEGKRILGTESYAAKPRTDFTIKLGTESFPLIVRLGEAEQYRVVRHSFKERTNVNIPIEINSEIRPTGGGVKIAIRPIEDTDVLKKSESVELHWDQAEEKLCPPVDQAKSNGHAYSFPFILESKGDEAERRAMHGMLPQVISGANLRSLESKLQNSLKPKGQKQYRFPFGNVPFNGWDTEKWKLFFENINNISCYNARLGIHGGNQNWINSGGCLFHFASEDLVEAIHEKVMTMPFPRAVRSSALFWSYGRICKNPKLMEQYLERCYQNWEELCGMPEWLFWPFQKSISMYGEIALIDRDIAASVFECAVDFFMLRVDNRFQSKAFNSPNWLKWTLAAVLFGLRVREIHPDFMSLNPNKADPNELEMARSLEELLETPPIDKEPIPKFALPLDLGPDAPTLSELVLKFLRAEADDKDQDLAGGIAKSS